MMDKSLRGGRLFVRLAVVALLGLSSLVASAASWYWRGDGKDWNGTDNPGDTANGYWWNSKSDGTGSWGLPGGTTDYTYVGNGKLCVIPSGCTLTENDISQIYINTAGCSSNGSLLRVDEGAVLENVGICVCGIQSWGGTEGALHINGGTLTLGDLSGKKRALLIGQTATANGIGRAWMTSGTLTIERWGLSVGNCNGGDQTSARGIFALTNGTVTLKADSSVGSTTSRYDVVEGGTFIQAGGSLTVASDKVLNVFGAYSSFDMSGGTMTGPLAASYGATLRFSGTADYTGTLLLSSYLYEKPIPGFTNTLEVSGGSVTITGLEGGSGIGGKGISKYGNLPCRVLQTGGTLTFPGIMGFGNRKMIFEVSGGTCYAGGTGSGNMVTCNRPYYFRIKGTPTVNVAACAGAGGDYYHYQTNSIMEHVIDARGLAPIIQRTALAVVGHQRIRPDGGVQLLNTNRFELTRSPSSQFVGTSFLGSLPDENLWQSQKIEVTDDGKAKAFGCRLNEAAALPGSGADRSATFSARPFGTLDLGAVRTNQLNCLNVALTVAAPEGRDLDETLARVAAGLVAAGYSNVVANAAAERNVTFSIPRERVPNRCAGTKLLFDFTETPMPAEGLLAGLGTSFYPTVTNALVTAVSLRRDRNPEGLAVVLR